MTSLTFLDHSSSDALVDDLKRYIGCVEALKTVVLEDPPSVSMPWTLLDVGRGVLPSDWRGPSASPFSCGQEVCSRAATATTACCCATGSA